MAATNIIVGSDVAFITDAGGTVVLGGTPFLTPDTGITIMPIAAQMDGVASVAVAGHSTISAAGQMNGVASVLFSSINVTSGAIAMDGQAQVLINSITLAKGAARMDGQAQVSLASANLAKGAARMDGRASEVVLQSVTGAGLAEMSGEASMLAVSPHVYNLYLQDGIISSEAILLHSIYKRTMSQAIVGGELSKQKLRYHVVFNNQINLSHSISFKMRFIKVLEDVTITMTPDLIVHSQFHYDFTFPINVQPTLIPDWSTGINLVQSLLVSQTTSQKFIWGRTLTQALKILTDTSAGSQYKQSLSQLFKIIELEGFKLRHPVALHQDIDLSLSLIGGYGLKLLQKLLLTSTPSPALSYHFTLTSQVRVADLIDKLFFAILTQLFTAHDVPTHAFTAIGSLDQLLTIYPAFNNKLILQIVGNIQLSPEQLVSMIYKGDPLLDEVVITALYISPSGTTTTWVVNTRTAAVTEYLNYDFQSFAQMGDRYVAAGAEGLYELDGDTDDGALIVSRLMSGYLQLNEKKLFGIKGAYVAIRGGGRFYLKLMAGDGREYIYELRAQPNLMTTKVKVGKGISTTYMAFELVTEGQDFDLDSIEFIPMTRGRRV